MPLESKDLDAELFDRLTDRIVCGASQNQNLSVWAAQQLLIEKQLTDPTLVV
jgi:hypothetical protein